MNIKKFVLIGIPFLVVIIIIGSILFINSLNTKNTLEDKLQIRLPSGARIIKYTAQNDELYAKIKLSDNDIDIIKDRYRGLDGRIGMNGFYYYSDEYDPSFRDNIPDFFSQDLNWWDLDTKHITFCYNIYKKTGSYWLDFKHQLGIPGVTWIFITNDSKGDKYLYLAQYVTEKPITSKVTDTSLKPSPNPSSIPVKTRPATAVFKAALAALINEDYALAGGYVDIPNLSSEDSKKLWTELIKYSTEYDPTTDKLSSIQIIGEQGWEKGTIRVAFKSHFKTNGDKLRFVELVYINGEYKIHGLSKWVDSFSCSFVELLRNGHLPDN